MEWKELEIDNLPPDILTGGYEIGDYDTPENVYRTSRLHPVDCLNNIITSKESYRYYYRKPEPKPPTHEEICTKWWKVEAASWKKVMAYDPCSIRYSYSIDGKFENKEWFTGKVAADIPPEE
jgi:hypothetical protein